MKLTKLFLTSAVVLASVSSASSFADCKNSDFDKVVFDNHESTTPVEIGFGSHFFITVLMQNTEVATAYAELQKIGTIGSITVQKVANPKIHNTKMDRFVLSAYQSTGWTSGRIVASLTVDHYLDFTHVPADGRAQNIIHVGSIEHI